MSRFGIEGSPAFLDNLDIGGVVFNTLTLVKKNKNRTRRMKNSKLQLVIVVASLVGAVSARATITGDVTISQGNSWDVTWTDTSDNTPVNGFVAEIVGNSGATFDSPISLGFSPSWTGILANSTLTYATGPANGADRTVTLSFTDPESSYSGVVVDIFETYNGNVVDNQAWQWLDLPANTGSTENVDWAYISPALNPVPEASTMIAGALLLLPLGASTMRVLRKSQVTKE